MLHDDDDPRHGTLNGYNNHGCRCPRCAAVQAADMHRRRVEGEFYDECACGQPKDKRAEKCVACYNRDREAPHGTVARYRRCHCDLCREASNAARRERRARMTAEEVERVREYDRQRRRRERQEVTT